MSFKIYKASAGSGKTSKLVFEYLCLALAHPNKFRNILAITFTNDAARQMKSRIIGQLKQIIAVANEGIEADYQTADLQKALRLDINNLSLRASQLLDLILHYYDEFAISTIDSFTHKLVRVFARELELPANFETLLDTKELIMRVTDSILDKVGQDKEVTRLVLQFVKQKSDSEKSWNPEREIASFAEKSLGEDAFEALKSMSGLSLSDFFRMAGDIQKNLKTTEGYLQKKAEVYFGILRKGQVDPGNISGGATRGISGNFIKFTKGDFDKLDSLQTKLSNHLQKGDWVSKSKSAAIKKSVELITPELEALAKELLEFLNKKLPEYILLLQIIKNLYPIALLSEIQGIMEEMRQAEQAVHISEFNKRLSGIISTEPMPFIFARLGEFYEHYMIDEFQDTSILQWLNLLPLVSNALASFGKTSLVVGDAKQSIYRFRAGEVELFNTLPSLPEKLRTGFNEERAHVLEYSCTEKDKILLNRNFRTSGKIVDFNNAFFSFLRDHYPILDENYRSVYEDVMQDAAKAIDAGLVQLSFYDEDADEAHIQMDEDLIRQVYRLKMEHGFQNRDIAILNPKGEYVRRAARVLMSGLDSEGEKLEGLPVTSADSVELQTSPRVRLLIHTYQYLAMGRQKYHAAMVLLDMFDSGLIKKRTELEQAAAELKTNGSTNVLSKLAGLKTGQNAFLLQGSWYEIFEKLSVHFGLDQKSDPFLRFFLDALLEIASQHIREAESFMRWWEFTGKKKTVVVSPKTDAIKVMTVHKSKGLEFPVVIFPYADVSSLRSPKDQWVELPENLVPGLKSAMLSCGKEKIACAQQEKTCDTEKAKIALDLLNVFYVAMTRPEKALFIMAANKPQKGNTGQGLHTFLKAYLEYTEDWDKEQKIYEFGSLPKKHIPKPQGKKPPQTIDEETEKQANYKLWHEKIKLSFQKEHYWPDELVSARETGVLLHHLLSQINTITDVPRLLSTSKKMLKKLHVDIPRLENTLTELLQKPEIKKAFDGSGTVLNERSFLSAGHQLLRPDRMVLFDHSFMIIDYKTGQHQPDYEEKMREYAQQFSELSGMAAAGLFLVYLLEKPEVLEVPF